MLPDYVFDTPNLFCAFLEGPLSSYEMKLIFSKVGARTKKNIFGVNSQLDISDGSSIYTRETDIWSERSEEYQFGRLDVGHCSIYYEVGWELVIVGFKQQSQFEAFVTDIKYDEHFKDLYWSIDELAQYRIELTSSLSTADSVRKFFQKLKKNYTQSNYYEA